ncbi:hypothetical protein D3C72_1100530 [compost metagenome]
MDLAVAVGELDQRRERGGLARAGLAGDQDQALALEDGLFEHRVDAQRLGGQDRVGDDAKHHAGRALGLVDVAAEAADALHRKGQVHLLHRVEDLFLLRAHEARGVVVGHLGREHREVLEGRHLAPEHAAGRVAGLDVDVGRAPLHEVREHVEERLDAALFLELVLIALLVDRTGLARHRVGFGPGAALLEHGLGHIQVHEDFEKRLGVQLDLGVAEGAVAHVPQRLQGDAVAVVQDVVGDAAVEHQGGAGDRVDHLEVRAHDGLAAALDAAGRRLFGEVHDGVAGLGRLARLDDLVEGVPAQVAELAVGGRALQLRGQILFDHVREHRQAPQVFPEGMEGDGLLDGLFNGRGHALGSFCAGGTGRVCYTRSGRIGSVM